MVHGPSVSLWGKPLYDPGATVLVGTRSGFSSSSATGTEKKAVTYVKNQIVNVAIQIAATKT
jgi:hypothetical protein